MFFRIFEKMQVISLYWFAAQQQTITFRRQNTWHFCLQFRADFNERSPNFAKQQELAKNC